MFNHFFSLFLLIHCAEQLTTPITATATLAEASDAITKLRRSISEIHKESTKCQQQYVLDFSNISEDKDDDKRAMILWEMAKQERPNDAYARLDYPRGKSVKQQNIDQIHVPLSWPTFDNYSSDTPLDLQDPKTVTDPDD